MKPSQTRGENGKLHTGRPAPGFEPGSSVLNLTIPCLCHRIPFTLRHALILPQKLENCQIWPLIPNCCFLYRGAIPDEKVPHWQRKSGCRRHAGFATVLILPLKPENCRLGSVPSYHVRSFFFYIEQKGKKIPACRGNIKRVTAAISKKAENCQIDFVSVQH